jgi:hypothetical protein
MKHIHEVIDWLADNMLSYSRLSSFRADNIGRYLTAGFNPKVELLSGDQPQFKTCGGIINIEEALPFLE